MNSHARTTSPSRADIGAAIHRLGQARAAGDTTTADAVAELVALTTGTPGWLSERGARAQLDTWQGALARYAPARALRVVGPGDARRVAARAELHFYPQAGA